MKRIIALCVLLCALPAFGAPKADYGNIELLRDTWGVPHLFSDTDAGAMYGLGYATAEDRGFQMTYTLRMVQGRLSEVLGEVRMLNRKETSVDHDRKMRTFSFYRGAQRTAANLEPATVALLAAYCEGVNDSFAAQKMAGILHPLFDQLGLAPERWKPADCLAVWWHLGQFFATDGTRDLIARRTHDQSAPDRSARGPAAARDGGRGSATPTAPAMSPDAKPMPPDEAASVVKRGDVTEEWIKQLERYARERGLPRAGDGPDGPKFSHAWVVGGKRTTTGSSVLVSDPQTLVRNPSLFYQFHIQGQTFNARGIGVPGSPAFLIGFSEHVAWGITALGADQADLFLLDTDPARPDQYRFDGEWRLMKVHREQIHIKNREPLDFVVRETHLGPVATAFSFARPDEGEVALKRVPVCEDDRDTIQGALAMMRARNAREFNQALAGWRFPSANFVFGDREGNIGFKALAAIPVRSRLDPQFGRIAMPGHSSDQDWQEILPYDLLPQVANPAAGFLYSGNHRAIESWYPIPFGGMTGAGGDTIRSWRLRERLEAKDRFTPDDVRDIHHDTVNPARRDIVRIGLHLRDGLERKLAEETLEALRHLEPWYRAGASSALTSKGAELALELNTFFRLMNTDLALVYGGGESGLSYFLKTAAARIESDPKTEFSPVEQRYVEESLAAAWRSARQKYGPDSAVWNQKARDAVRKRKLGYFESLDGFPSLDPAEDLAFPALTVTDGGTIASQASQSYTQWAPMHDPDQALSILPIGQSERPDSPARTSTMELWEQGRLHPAPLSRKKVETLAVSRQRLDAKHKAATSPRLDRTDGLPEVWLCHGNLQALLKEDDSWAFVRDNLDGIKLYVDKIGRQRGAESLNLPRLVELARKHGIQLAVECGGTLEFAPLNDQNGERSAQIELAKIKPLTDAGGTLAYLDIDGAINRLLYPGEGRKGFTSVEDCVTELIDAMRAHRNVYPGLRFWLLVNFPNWGWKGDVSYHARGPQRQDWGDYFPVLQTILQRTRAEGIPFTGVTVDNPHDYAVGTHRSVNLRDPSKIDWIARIRDLEDYVEKEGLEFNLIVNSEAGGHSSDEAFYRETLAFVDAYLAAGGSPRRWIVQSWYTHPKAVGPEDAPHSMTALTKAVMQRVKPIRDQTAIRAQAPPKRPSAAGNRSAGPASDRITLAPQQGTMSVHARVPRLNATFALGVPETIGCREAMLLNFPETTIEWTGPDAEGAVSCRWGPGGRISYSARLVPSVDSVTVEMTIRNHTEFLWRDVFAFNCLNPVNAPAFKDWTLDRTFMSARGKPLRMAQTRRVQGSMPTVGFYLPERIEPGQESVFVRGFGATSPDRTDNSWIVTLSDPEGSYMAATAQESLFLFDNLDRCCIHSAPSFGDIGPNESSTTVSRFSFGSGSLEDFLERFNADKAALEPRQKWARPTRR